MRNPISFVLALILATGALFAAGPELNLITIESDIDAAAFKTREAAVTPIEQDGAHALRIDFNKSAKYPDVTFAPKSGNWDLSKYGAVSVELVNLGDTPAKVAVRLDNPGPISARLWTTSGATIPPGKTATIEASFVAAKGSYQIKPATISAIHVFVNRPAKPVALVVKSIKATGSPSKVAEGNDGTSPDLASAAAPAGTQPVSGPELIRFDGSTELPAMRNLDSESEVIDGPNGKMLKVAMGSGKPYPNIIFAPKAGSWNLSPYTQLEVDLVNLDEESIQVFARLDNPGASNRARSNGGKIALDPGEKGTLVIEFDREFATELRAKLIGMQHTPWGARGTWGGMIDPSSIVELNLYMNKPNRSHAFAITAVRATGSFDPASQIIPEPFFPFIDTYGQYRHKDWLNKIKSDADFARIKAEEAKSMDTFPRPTSWDKFGGWADGPQLEKTGHFYTKKIDGKWWLVDPEGRLFFSMGIDVVQAGTNGGTPIDERDGWFDDAPWGKADPFKAFINESKKDVTRGDYAGKSPRLYNFFAANLLRKYGSNWQEEWRALMPRRLMNWGFNTIGNWSDPEILKEGKIPYTHWVFLRTQKLPWQPNTRNPIPDPFNPMFAQEVRRAATRMTEGTTDDPYCIGYFVDNELTWDDEDTQGRATMAGNAKSYAKMEMLKDLRAKYVEIAALNTAWKTSFASWEAMVEGKDLPKTPAGHEDLKAFSAKLARQYFSTIRDVLREIAPNKLYLGCRFADHNPQVVAIAAEYCDIVSFNIYREKVAAWRPAADIDKPVIIGEFHFGANDRGVFGRGLVKASSAEDRAQKFLTYITGAAENPQLVGAHWFALADEPTSGRVNDEENHGFGFLSITDTPYQEMIDASREAAGEIYKARSFKKN